MVQTVSVSRVRILTDRESHPRRLQRTSRPRARAGEELLSTRRANASDIPWIESWSASLGLPAPTAGLMQFMLLRDGQRVGYLAARDQLLDVGRGPENVRWIVSAFLLPGVRGQGLLMRFGEQLSRQVYRAGKVGARIAAHNTRMLKLMKIGGWTKIGGSRRYSDFVLELQAPFHAGRA